MLKSFFKYLLFTAVILLSTLPAQAASHMQQDSQQKRKYSINVGQFSRIKLLDNVNVVYRNLPDSTGYVTYSGVDDFADSFIFTVSNETLKIQVTTEDVNKPDLPTLYIYSDFLTQVENSSSFSLTVESVVPCSDFKAVQIGNGSIFINNIRANNVTAVLGTGKGFINISGDCLKETIRLVGTGTIQTDRLQALESNVRIAGSGTVGVWAINKLSVRGIGSTKVYYKGNPRIKKSGGGKLFPLPDNADYAER